jgi:hypothetical protein
MTIDRLISDGAITTIQALKFDYIGDFDYLIYMSRSSFNYILNDT